MTTQTSHTELASLADLNKVEGFLTSLIEREILPPSYQKSIDSIFKQSRLFLASQY